jgi:hypothetical protein
MSSAQILPFYGSSGSGGGGSGGGGGSSAGVPSKPRILYDNLTQSPLITSVVATSEPDAVNYAAANAYDNRPFTYWKALAGTQYITFTFSSAVSVNAFAHYSTGQETIGPLGGNIQLQYSLDGGANWLDFGALSTPTTSKPIYVTASAVSAAKWRVRFVCVSDFYVSIISFGTDFAFQRHCWNGFSPPKLGRSTKITNNISQNAIWLGRTIQRNGSELMFDFSHLTPSWVNDVWYPFVLWAEVKPWFLLWAPVEYPADPAFCWSDDEIPAPSYMHANFMKAAMKVAGRVE